MLRSRYGNLRDVASSVTSVFIRKGNRRSVCFRHRLVLLSNPDDFFNSRLASQYPPPSVLTQRLHAIESSLLFQGAAGFLAVLPVCFAIAWAPCNVRYFCLSFTLFGISLALLAFRVPGARPLLQSSLGLVVVWSAISLPLHCAQRRPLDLWNAIFAREEVGLGQRPEMIGVYDDVLRLRMNGASQWFLVAAENSCTLPFLNQAKMEWQLTPQWGQVEACLASTGPNESYALVLNTFLPKDLPVEVVKQYPLSTFIVRVFPPK